MTTVVTETAAATGALAETMLMGTAGCSLVMNLGQVKN